MSVRKLKPITPAQRFRVVNGFDAITTDKPEKSLLTPKKRSGGRNNKGKMTARHIGGGHKKQYRIIDFKRNKFDVAAEVKTIEYDPNRSAFIALVEYIDGEKRYIIAPNGLKVGQQTVSGESASPEIGNTLFLSKIPLGTIISCIEFITDKISQHEFINLFPKNESRNSEIKQMLLHYFTEEEIKIIQEVCLDIENKRNIELSKYSYTVITAIAHLIWFSLIEYFLSLIHISEPTRPY